MSNTVRYQISDGELVLTLEPAEEGGFVVTSPFDAELVTQADTIEEAFTNARDAADALHATRKSLDQERTSDSARDER